MTKKLNKQTENEIVEPPVDVSSEPTPSASTPSAAGLGVNDLLLMLQTVQVIARRGGFRADEMANVGGLHDRLLAFLETSGAITRQPTPSTEEGNDAGGTIIEPTVGDTVDPTGITDPKGE
mgnify:CR=1 FL=1|jgi:hypothetical protein